jgi:hypothetical protein
VNWFLSLAPVFVLHDSQDAFGSISCAVEFCRHRASAVAWSSTAFGLLHFVVFVLATAAVFVPLALLRVLPRGIVLGAVLLLTMLYFAMVDFLYMGRLAAYISLLHVPQEAPLESSQLSVPGSPSTTTLLPIPPSDDDILSDVPGLVPPPVKPGQ